MEELRNKLRANLFASLILCIMVGASLSYLYGLARGVFSPMVNFIAANTINIESDSLWLHTWVLNITYSIFCGFVVSIIGLGIIQYIIRPKSMLYLQVAAVPYVIMSYWWFVSDVDGISNMMSTEQTWVTLLSPLGAILVWLMCSAWLSRRNSLNKNSLSDAKDARQL